MVNMINVKTVKYVKCDVCGKEYKDTDTIRDAVSGINAGTEVRCPDTGCDGCLRPVVNDNPNDYYGNPG
jgi:hypothetical protein